MYIYNIYIYIYVCGLLASPPRPKHDTPSPPLVWVGEWLTSESFGFHYVLWSRCSE